MGEYATYGAGRIKIGTCEDMLYLRFDQRTLVRHEEGNVDVMNPRDLGVVRFRFPWPDEDGTEPGHFDRPDRTVAIEHVPFPEGLEHGIVQLQNREAGYAVNLPCPEGPGPHPVPQGGHGTPMLFRNGFRGRTLLKQQAVRDGKLVSIFECGGCGAAFRVMCLAALEEAIAWCRSRVEGPGVNSKPDKWYRTVADRISAGYLLDVNTTQARARRAEYLAREGAES